MHPRRLIDTRTCRLVEFPEDVLTPPYAILSHRWLHGEEVTLQEFMDLRQSRKSMSKNLHGWIRGEGIAAQELSKLMDETRKKLGYRKILAACNQARHDKLDFLWIDTCCIDKSDHNEVARNINSMFSYYHNSAVCYVHLADVWREGMPWESATFGGSKWFRRGWTLQELLAPRKVIFFNSGWKRIGDKHQLKGAIHYLTGIPTSVLDGTASIQSIDIETRMSWCVGRQTTKPPDLAYCLLGILGVFLEPDYSEDIRSAFQRLQTAVIQSYPESLEAFEDGEDIFSVLVRQNVRARVGSDTKNRDEIGGGSGVNRVRTVYTCIKPNSELRNALSRNSVISTRNSSDARSHFSSPPVVCHGVVTPDHNSFITYPPLLTKIQHTERVVPPPQYAIRDISQSLYSPNVQPHSPPCQYVQSSIEYHKSNRSKLESPSMLNLLPTPYPFPHPDYCEVNSVENRLDTVYDVTEAEDYGPSISADAPLLPNRYHGDVLLRPGSQLITSRIPSIIRYPFLPEIY